MIGKLRKFLDKKEKEFQPGEKYSFFYPIFELIDTFLFTPGEVTKNAPHVRDALEQKRMMIIVVFALFPCILWALFNTGYQINLNLENQLMQDNWRHKLFFAMGFSYNHLSILANMILGSLYFVPIYFITMLSGGLIEVVFATIRKHPINEGFLVTGALIPLVLPPTIPLWLVAVGTIFGITFGKEIFGGVGRNFLNPALTARVFLFFAYPAYMSGNAVWTGVDGFSQATPLGVAAEFGLSGIQKMNITWFDAFFGFIQGSMGETSTLMCCIGAFILLITGIASWRTMFFGLLGMLVASVMLNLIGSTTNLLFNLPFYWHLVLGGAAFGLVFMATDPVSSAFTNTGKIFYGFLIGFFAILIRVVNPAFPEGMMLAILFGNVFAPFIDHFVVEANKKRRLQRNAN